MQKTFLVLPGTIWQVPLIDKIRQMGHKALVVNPAPDSPCFTHADGFLQADIFDRERVLNFGRENRVDAVLSDQCDIVMNLIAELGEYFQVPTLDKASASLFTDKYLMREFCRRHKLPCPEYRLCEKARDAIGLLNEVRHAIIIKPLDSNASHGVFKCTSEADILAHFDEALSFSRIEKKVLAERFIEGTEFTVDGIKTPSMHYTLAISEKNHFKHNENIANQLLFTHQNPNFDYDLLRKTNDAFVKRSGLQFGFTHAEYKCENGVYYLVEIAARGGGNMISSIITQYMTGYDTYRYLIECAAGNIHDEEFYLKPEYSHRAAVLKFFCTPHGGGIVKEIVGEDYLKEEKDVRAFSFNFKPGDEIRDALNDSARIGFYIACSENLSRLKAIMQNVENTVKIIVE